MRMLSVVLMALMAAPLGASAQAVYKHVDKDGKVYYSDKPPAKDEKGKQLDVDSKRNVIPALVPKAGEKGVSADSDRADRRIEKQDRLLAELDAAKEQLAAAKEALATGMEPQEDEWITTTGAGGKPRRTVGEAYHARIRELEDNVKKAEADLSKAELAYRRGVSN